MLLHEYTCKCPAAVANARAVYKELVHVCKKQQHTTQMLHDVFQII